MTDADSRSNRLHRLRRWVYAPLIASVAAGAVCTGVGIGNADNTSGVPDTTWRVHNFTGQTLTGGKFGKADEGHLYSTIYVEGLAPGESREGMYESGDFTERNGTMADEVCYEHRAWSLRRQQTSFGKWHDVFVFYDNKTETLFITPQGGGDDHNLFAAGNC